MKFTKSYKLKTNKRKKLVSQIQYCPKVAKSFSKTEYYVSMAEDIIHLPEREKEKIRRSTGRQDRVTRMFKHYKTLLKEKGQGYFYTLKGLYDTNRNAVLSGSKPPVHTNLVGLVASIPNLITAYARIRGNKGATTLGAMLSFIKLKSKNPFQRRFLSRTTSAPEFP